MENSKLFTLLKNDCVDGTQEIEMVEKLKKPVFCVNINL